MSQTPGSIAIVESGLEDTEAMLHSTTGRLLEPATIGGTNAGHGSPPKENMPVSGIRVLAVHSLGSDALLVDRLPHRQLAEVMVSVLGSAKSRSTESQAMLLQYLHLIVANDGEIRHMLRHVGPSARHPREHADPIQAMFKSSQRLISDKPANKYSFASPSVLRQLARQLLGAAGEQHSLLDRLARAAWAQQSKPTGAAATSQSNSIESDDMESYGDASEPDPVSVPVESERLPSAAAAKATPPSDTKRPLSAEQTSAEQTLEYLRFQSAETDGPVASSAHGGSDVAIARRCAPASSLPTRTASAAETSERAIYASLRPATGPVARQPGDETAVTDRDGTGGVVDKAKGAKVDHKRGNLSAISVSIGSPSVSPTSLYPSNSADGRPVGPTRAPGSSRRASIDLEPASGFESDDSAASSIYAQPAADYTSSRYSGLFAATGYHPTRVASPQRAGRSGDQSRLVRRAHLAYHSMQHAAVLRRSLDSRHMASTSNASGAMRYLDAWLSDHPSGRFAPVGVDLDLYFAGSSPVMEAMPSSGSYGLPALALPSGASVESTENQPASTCEDDSSIVPRGYDGMPRSSAVHGSGAAGSGHSGGSGADTAGQVSAFLHRACTDASKSYFVVRRPGSYIVRVFSLQRSHDGISDHDGLKSDRKSAEQQYADDTNQATHPGGVTLSLVGLLDLDSSHEWILHRAESAGETPQVSRDRSSYPELRRQLDSVPAESLSAIPLGAIFELLRASGAEAVSMGKKGALYASYPDEPDQPGQVPLPPLPGMHYSPPATSKQAPPLFRDRLATLCVRNARKLLGAAAADQQILREGHAAEFGGDAGGASGSDVSWSDSFHTSCDSVDLAVRMLQRASEILAPEHDSAGVPASDGESHGQTSGSSSFGSIVRAASRFESHRDGSVMQGWLNTVAETCSAIEFSHASKLAAAGRRSYDGEGDLGAGSGRSDCWQHCHTHASEFEVGGGETLPGKGSGHELWLIHYHLEQSLCSQLLFTMKAFHAQLDGICWVLSATSSFGGSATTQNEQDHGYMRFQVEVICDIVVKAIRCTTGSVRALRVIGCRSTMHSMANLIESLIGALAAVCAGIDQRNTPYVRSAIAELVCVVDAVAPPDHAYPRKHTADPGSVEINSELLECVKQMQEAVDRAVGTAQLEGAVHSISSALVQVGAMCCARIRGTGTGSEASAGHGDASEVIDEHVRMIQLASCIISPFEVPSGSGNMSIPVVPSGHLLDGGQRKLSDVVLLPTLRPLTTRMSTQRDPMEGDHESTAPAYLLPSTRAALQHRLPALYYRTCDSRQVSLGQIQGWALLHQSMPLHISIALEKEDRAGSASAGSSGAAGSKSRRSRRTRGKGGGGGGPSSRASAAHCSKAQKVSYKQWVYAHAGSSCVILSLLAEQILQRWVVPPSRSAAGALSPLSYDFVKHCIEDASRSLLLYGQPAGTIYIYACLLSLTEPDAKVAGLAAFLEALPGPLQPNRPRLLLKPKDLLKDGALLLSRLAALGGSCVNACLSLASSGVQPRQNSVLPVRLLSLCLGAIRASYARGARAPSVASKGSLQYVVSPGSGSVELAIYLAFRCACWAHGSSRTSSHTNKLSSLSVPAESLLCICSRIILKGVFDALWSADTYRRVCKPLLRDMRKYQSQFGSPGLTAAGDAYLPSQVQLSYAPLASLAHRIATPPDEKHPFLAAMHLLCAAERGRRTVGVPPMGRLVAAELAQIYLQISAADDLVGAAGYEKSFADERVSMFAASAEAANEGTISDRRRRARQAAVEVCYAALEPLLSAYSLLEFNPNYMFSLLRSLAEDGGTSIPDCADGRAATADGRTTVPLCDSESNLVWTPAEVYPLVAKKLPVSLLYQRPFDEPDLATTGAAGDDGGAAKRTDAVASSSGCQDAMMVWMRGMVAMKKRLAGNLAPGDDGVIAAASAGMSSSSASRVAMQSREQLLLLDLMLRSAVLSSTGGPAESRSHRVEIRDRGAGDRIASTSLGTRIMEIGRVDSFQEPATMIALLQIIQRFGLGGKHGGPMEILVTDALLGGCWARGMPNLIMQRIELLVQSGSTVCSQEQAKELIDIIEKYTSRIQFMEKGTLGLKRLQKATSSSARSLIAALRALG